MSGQLVDASIVVRPEQRNTRAEKQAMNEGRVPEDWQAKPARLRHEESRCPPDDQSIWRSPSSVTRTILAPTVGTWKRTREQAYPVLLFRADVLDTGPDGGPGRVRPGDADRHRSAGRASCGGRGSPARDGLDTVALAQD